MESPGENIAVPGEIRRETLSCVGRNPGRYIFPLLQVIGGCFLDVIAVRGYPTESDIGVMKFGPQQAEVLPLRGAAMDDFPVTGPRILLQFGDRPYDSRTQGVEMDVLHHIEEIPGFVYGRRLVSILEEVPYPIVPLIEILGISRQQTLHEGRKRTRIALQ